MTSLSELINKFTLRRNELEAEIQTNHVMKDKLLKLKTQLQRTTEYFDEDDLQAIDKEINKRDVEIEDLKKQLVSTKEKQKEEEAILRELERVINTRMDVLEQDSDTNLILEKHPELLSFFVTKHKSLQNLMDEKVSETLSNTLAQSS